MNYFITSNGLPIHVSDSGGAKPVVALLHGYLETHAVWDDFITSFENDFRIIRIDLPGHGLSGTAAVNTVDFSAQILHDVLQKQGIAECVVGGHSMGGYTAQAFAANYPEATRGLCLFHSTPNADTPQKQAGRDREIALIRAGKMALVIAKGITHMFAEENVRRFAEKIRELSEIADVHDPEGIIACLEGMKQRPDRNGFLASFDKPLLFIFGEKDRYISLEAAHELANRFPHVQTLWLAHSGHNGFIEEPEVVGERFRLFLQHCRQAPV
ncbi:MAG: alpha/beta hydrolase [Prevotellaceae bacterium]|jgi:pimeloyl-ACP methyl ester carboxylesterase|nr:alpha/beta hydrolase [Prevotellaceae bacterium]